MKTMKRFSVQHVFKLALLILAALLAWSLWAQAQPVTNATAPPTSPPLAAAKAEAKVWLTFGLDRIGVLQRAPFGDIPLWQYLASFVYIFLAFYFSKFIDYFIRERVRQWAKKTRSELDDLFIDLVRGPVKIIVFVILLHIGMQVYSWP